MKRIALFRALYYFLTFLFTKMDLNGIFRCAFRAINTGVAFARRCKRQTTESLCKQHPIGSKMQLFTPLMSAVLKTETTTGEATLRAYWTCSITWSNLASPASGFRQYVLRKDVMMATIS